MSPFAKRFIPSSVVLSVCALSLPAMAAPPSSNWHTVFSDDFNTFDTSKWSKGYKPTMPGGTKNRHNHAAWMADSNVSVSNGKLVLSANAGLPSGVSSSNPNGPTLAYTSGAINSAGKFSVTDAYVEASIKTSGVRGTWPAFWMLSEANTWPPEIDIMENPVYDAGDSNRRFHYNLHYGQDWQNKSSFGSQKVHSSSLSSGFNTYGMAWSSNYIEFYFNDVRLHRYNRSEPDTANNMYLIFNLAVGGWGGTPANPFPNTNMQVDWVKVWKYGPAPLHADAPLPEPATLGTLAAMTMFLGRRRRQST